MNFSSILMLPIEYRSRLCCSVVWVCSGLLIAMVHSQYHRNTESKPTIYRTLYATLSTGTFSALFRIIQHFSGFSARQYYSALVSIIQRSSVLFRIIQEEWNFPAFRPICPIARKHNFCGWRPDPFTLCPVMSLLPH
jgi:hypothetical protein